MIELYVENEKVDVDKSFSVMISLAIDDIKDFGAKNTGYCLYTKYEYSAYILVGGIKMEVTESYIDDPFTSTICVP